MIPIWIKSWNLCQVHHIRVSTDRSRRDDLSGRSQVWGCLHRSNRYHRNTTQTAFWHQTIFSTTRFNYSTHSESDHSILQNDVKEISRNCFFSGWIRIVLRPSNWSDLPKRPKPQVSSSCSCYVMSQTWVWKVNDPKFQWMRRFFFRMLGLDMLSFLWRLW